MRRSSPHFKPIPVSGITMLMAGAAAGWLWDRFGAPFTIYAGAVLAAMTLTGLVLRIAVGRIRNVNGPYGAAECFRHEITPRFLRHRFFKKTACTKSS